ncbi:DNA cytosine methyltransferase [Brevibacillus parabrevis]|uniref:DNA cytosine methyltransferase n=1 Tax=Brevibacillus parabrevis TaxID=54914 RepID=UPI002E207D1B|nr:DNA cytosine methyltransferase [Brevibacillus parabrevis]MED2258270.1 DNA cytosine methyltransferase [Brevibacillus parabrevis]
MKIAVLFDGAGLARLGLEQAGHECVGFEIDPWKHHLSKFVGSGNTVLADATKVDLSGFDAVWASPPCQKRSMANQHDVSNEKYAQADDFLEYSLNLPHEVLWVENVIEKGGWNDWGSHYNAAQFLRTPIQCRNRIIGGRYKEPNIFRPYQYTYPKLDICPAIMASQGQGGYAPLFKRAEGYYGRKMTLEECAYHQGFTVPTGWYRVPDGVPSSEWNQILFEAVGNGVPVYMARAFGEAYPASTILVTKKGRKPKGYERRKVSLALTHEVWELIDDLVSPDQAQSDVLRELILEGMKRKKLKRAAI